MRGRLIHWPGVLRFLVRVVVAIALIVAAALLPHHARQPVASTRLAAPSKPTNVLVRELARCEDLDEKAQNDAACLQAWSENRDRFFDRANSVDATPNARRDGNRRSASQP